MNDCLRYWGGHKRVEGRDRDQRLLGEELSKEREGQGGVAEPECGQGSGTQQGGVGRTMRWPYAPTGATSDDDDDENISNVSPASFFCT